MSGEEPAEGGNARGSEKFAGFVKLLYICGHTNSKTDIDMTFAEKCNEIFNKTTLLYHMSDDVDAKSNNPYEPGSVEAMLYDKCWIDAVQWHLEDLIRDPEIDPVAALALKRRIDRSNQDRTDKVEDLDTYFMNLYRNVTVHGDARLNTESPAWALDRLSILALKIYHMEVEAGRNDASDEHRKRCRQRLNVLLQQREDLTTSIDQLLEEIASGKKFMRAYRQMKMYNDPSTNPVLYGGSGK